MEKERCGEKEGVKNREEDVTGKKGMRTWNGGRRGAGKGREVAWRKRKEVAGRGGEKEGEEDVEEKKGGRRKWRREGGEDEMD